MKVEHDFYMIQGIDNNGNIVTKPYDDGIIKKTCLILIYKKT